MCANDHENQEKSTDNCNIKAKKIKMISRQNMPMGFPIWASSYMRCPYCAIPISDDIECQHSKFPRIWIPFYRCRACGELMYTGSLEYLMMPVEERIRIKPTDKNCENIVQSLKRTTESEYIKFLKQHGYTIYPLTDRDKEHFRDKIHFPSEIPQQASEHDRNLLYEYGVLIRTEDIDLNTGTYKEEILKENQQKTLTFRQKIWAVLAVAGLLIGFIISMASSC